MEHTTKEDYNHMSNFLYNITDYYFLCLYILCIMAA